MKTLISIILIFVFVFPGCGVSKSQTALSKDNDLVKLSLEFIRLRNIHGHFQGGSWNDEVDSWMGLKHRVMLELRSYTEQNLISAGELRKLMGEPDRILYIGGPPWDPVTSWTTADFSLIYEWRGDHDFLVFDCRAGLVISSHWQYAGE